MSGLSLKTALKLCVDVGHKNAWGKLKMVPICLFKYVNSSIKTLTFEYCF